MSTATLEPNDLLLFARVVDEGSFSRAGERLGLPKSTVSRRLAGLETQLGERLLLRTTRKLTVTDFGHSVLEHARQVVAEVEAASSLAQHRQAEPSGRLRLSIPGDFANVVLGQLMTEFTARYPAITLQVDVSPRRVDRIDAIGQHATQQRQGELGQKTAKMDKTQLRLRSRDLEGEPSQRERKHLLSANLRDQGQPVKAKVAHLQREERIGFFFLG